MAASAVWSMSVCGMGIRTVCAEAVTIRVVEVAECVNEKSVSARPAAAPIDPPLFRKTDSSGTSLFWFQRRRSVALGAAARVWLPQYILQKLARVRGGG